MGSSFTSIRDTTALLGKNGYEPFALPPIGAQVIIEAISLGDVMATAAGAR